MKVGGVLNHSLGSIIGNTAEFGSAILSSNLSPVSLSLAIGWLKVYTLD